MSQILIQKRLCANFNCNNILTEFELERISTSYCRYIYCRTCRYLFGFGKVLSNKCRDCGEKINSDRMVCDTCRRMNKTGYNYHDRKCAYRNCDKIIPKGADARMKFCSHSHCNTEHQMRWRERK